MEEISAAKRIVEGVETRALRQEHETGR